MSARFTLNKEDAIKILKVFGYSVASAGVVALGALWAKVQLPEAYFFMIPLVNTLLVTLQKFIESKPLGKTAQGHPTP